MDVIKKNRCFMHCPSFKGMMEESDQQKGVVHPPHSKAVFGDTFVLSYNKDVCSRDSYTDLLDVRRSERVYTGKALTQAELAFMLWSAQGIQCFRGDTKVATLRPVPSGGARHPFELYAVVKNVDGMKPGIYRYAPLLNVGEKSVTVEFCGEIEDYENRITAMLAGQKWAANAPVVLFFSCVPYRAEWRYTAAAHRVMLIDLGHAGQNVMLSAAALGLGSCCIAAYDQELCDKVFGFDGLDEYVVYAVTIGEAKNA